MDNTHGKSPVDDPGTNKGIIKMILQNRYEGLGAIKLVPPSSDGLLCKRQRTVGNPKYQILVFSNVATQSGVYS
jgi:hypothetical protein